jgi:hypothetical protein
LKKLYHFLGSVTFAIIIIFLTAVFVVAGTLIESETKSHLKAAFFTYDNPFFKILLTLFFINILIAALRRMPFKIYHIPFLMVHLGLLMIIAGCFVKNIWGLQGHMIIKEGSSSSLLYIPNTLALNIETPNHSELIKINPFYKTLDSSFEGLTLKIKNIFPHCEKQLTFFDNERVYVEENAYSFIENYFIENTSIEINNINYPLKNCLEKIRFSKQSKLITTKIQDHVYNVQSFGNELIKITTRPSFFILQDQENNSSLFAINSHGFIYECSGLEDIAFYSIDNGFGGYKAVAWLPRNFQEIDFNYLILSLEKILYENFAAFFLSQDLNEFFLTFKNFCESKQLNPAQFLTQFLINWYTAGTRLSNEKNELLENFDFKALNQEELNGFKWVYLFWDKLDQEEIDLNDVDLVFVKEILKENVPGSHHQVNISNALFSMKSFKNIENLTINNSKLLSSYLLMQSLSPVDFYEYFLEDKESFDKDSKIALKLTHLESLNIWEDNKPMLEIELSQNEFKDTLQLFLDDDPKGLKWPCLNGKYLLRLQPYCIKIPHKIRLREAKKIDYEKTSKAYSFESQCLIDDFKEATLSQNEPYETEDHYRFYMSYLIQSGVNAAKTAVFAVNQDPSKKWLAFPGFSLLSIGIFLLLWKKKNMASK